MQVGYTRLMMLPTEHFIQLPTVTLRYLQMGDAANPLLFLLHGVTDNADYWGWLGRELAQRYHIVALDQRGHGKSGAPEDGYRMSDYVADAAQVLRSVTTVPAIVMGHSFGGWVANRLAAEHPELVSKLILEDPPFRADAPQNQTVGEQDQQRWDWFQWQRDCEPMSHLEKIAHCHQIHPTWSDEDCELWATSKAQVRPRIYQANGIEWDLKWAEAAAQVICPTLLIYGEGVLGSIVDDVQAGTVERLMSNCRAVKIANTGHGIHRENREAMLQAVLAFLS